MKQLDFTLSLIDKLSRPLKQVQNNVTGFADKSKAAFMQIGGSVLALAGTGMAIKGALSPAIEMYDALNDAAAKGIDSTALKTVQRDALAFSTTYGASAVEFVKSTEEINAAIAGLTGNELPKVTKVANVLAFAMKSTAAETSEFMGQMFGNFSSDAAHLGKVQFAEQLAGKMVFMRKTFGTEMATIKDLMEGARGVGTNYGTGMGGAADVVIMMVSGQTHDGFMASLNNLVDVFPSPAFTQVRRLAQSAAQLATEKMQIPAKYSQSLPAAIPLSVPTSRTALAAAAVIKAQQEAAAVADLTGVKKLMEDFTQQRESLISGIASGLAELQGKSARARVFTASGDLPSTLLELVKGIPLQSSVYTAAMMLVGDNLDGIKGMIHDIEPDTGA